MIGHVYKIVNDDESIRYVGSTLKTIEQRWNGHVRAYTYGKDFPIYKHFREYGIDQFRIELIKSYDVVDQAHLRVFETLHINRLKCVNEMVAFTPLTDKQRSKLYRESNKEVIADKHKIYYEANKESINAKHKIYREANKDAITEKIRLYREANRESILAQLKRYREANRDAIRAKQSVQVPCGCGSTYTHNNKARHLRTARHKKLIECNMMQLNDINVA